MLPLCCGMYMYVHVENCFQAVTCPPLVGFHLFNNLVQKISMTRPKCCMQDGISNCFSTSHHYHRPPDKSARAFSKEPSQ